MENTSLVESIQTNFGFLFENYKFEIIATTPNIVTLASPINKLRVILERQQVFVDLGPISSVEDWFDLMVVVAYLAQDPAGPEWQYDLPRGVTVSKAIELQFVRLAGILQEHMGQITPLFRETTFNHIQPDLVEFRKKKSAARLKRLQGK